MLEVKQIVVFRGEVPVLQELSLQVGANEIVSIIGANGAGKTTLFESILGYHQPVSGGIEFRGMPIQRKCTHDIARMGIAIVPEGRRLFTDMTVLENIEIGSSSIGVLKNPYDKKNKLDFIFSLFPVLSERLNQMAGTLSGGEQQMVSIARALMLNPKLLMIDELSLGLSPKFTKEVFQALKEIKNQGVSIILAEQNVSLALQQSDRGYVMESGKIVQEGISCDLISDAKIRLAYLGL